MLFSLKHLGLFSLSLSPSSLKYPDLPERLRTLLIYCCVKWLPPTTTAGFSAQLLLHSAETGLIKEMDRCLAVFPLMAAAFITLHALLLYVKAVMNESESE